MRTRRGRLVPRTTLARCSALVVLVMVMVTGLALVGCVRTSGGAWYVSSAPLPEGWPELTPVGEVRIRAYPNHRAARTTRALADIDDERDGTGRMFRVLFEHIKQNDIAMTAPVDMGYPTTGDVASAGGMSSMAFLYRTNDLGETGSEGMVRIEDVPRATYASVGVRGGYGQTNFEKGLAKVRAWLDTQDTWTPDGPPRYLGYNGPFTPWFMRYGEVQVPVIERDILAPSLDPS